MRLHPGANEYCPHCSGVGAVVVRDGEFARSQECVCLGKCPLCKGTGWISVGDGALARRSRCTCTALRRRMAAFDAANIPARHATSTRVSFKPVGIRQSAVMGGVSNWVSCYRPGEENRGVVLYGDVGRGKTHLMVSMLRDLVFQHGVSVRFVEFSHLLAEIKYGFDSGEGPGRLMEPLVRVDVLAIDELGKGRNTEFEGTVLDELVSRRYNAAATILATTNFPPERATGKAAPSAAAVAAKTESRPALVDRVGDRVFSRLQEMCDFIHLPGEDWRELSRRERRS